MIFWRKQQHNEVEKGLKELFPRLWRYCLVLTASSDRADDLSQSVCLRALQKSKQYQSGTDLDRWVFRIAKTMWFNELRADAVRQGGGLQVFEELDLPDTVNINPEMGMINKDILVGVLALPEAQRIVVGLVYIEGYSYKEAAELLNIPIGTIMSRLSAARASLSKRFKHYQSDVV